MVDSLSEGEVKTTTDNHRGPVQDLAGCQNHRRQRVKRRNDGRLGRNCHRSAGLRSGIRLRAPLALYHAHLETGAPSVTVGVGGSAGMHPVDCS